MRSKPRDRSEQNRAGKASQKRKERTKSIRELRQKILAELPPSWRFRPEDSAVLGKHKDFLLSLTGELVQGFYDTLLAHPGTQSVFQPGERPQREQTLTNFWQRAVPGPHDDSFWDWVTWVGVVHIRRKVTNPMMLAAWGYILNLVQQKLIGKLSPEEGAALMASLSRLAFTAAALTADGYLRVYLDGLAQGVGMSEELVERIVRVEQMPLLEQRYKP